MNGFISGFSVLFYWSAYLILVPAPHDFDYCGFVIIFEIGMYESFDFFLFLSSLLPNRIVWAVGAPLQFHMNFWITLSVSAKKLVGVFIQITLSQQFNLGRIAILTMLNFQNWEDEMSFRFFQVFLNLFQHCFAIFSAQVFHLLDGKE